MSQDKSTRWAFTAYEGQYACIESIAKDGNDLIAEIGWQDEVCPKTQKKHRQGYVRTVRQVRFTQLSVVMNGIHLEKAKNWDALVKYCRKEATRDVSGSQVHVTYQRPMRLHEILEFVAEAFFMAERDKHGRISRITGSLDRQTDRQIKLAILRQYSQEVITRHPEYAVVLVRADARDAWCDYFDVWLDKARRSQGWGEDLDQ